MTFRTAAIAVALLLGAAGGIYWYVEDEFAFDPEPAHKDRVETNAAATPDQFDLTFAADDGQVFDLARFRGRKNVMLVFMRGYPGEICINCSAQTSRLIRSHAEFARRDTEILVVFPGPRENLPKFLTAGRAKADNADVPFPVLLDPDYAAVDKLGIRGSMAKPSTYILDKKGRVRFAYVGAYTGDRPSVKAMLDQIDRFRRDGENP